jgi:hypothetical protein
MGNNFGINRRQFLKAALGAGAAIGFPSIVPAKALGRNGHTAANNRLNIGVLGLGYGWPMFLQDDGVQYVAVCDVQKQRRESAKKRVEDRQGVGTCSVHNDFREVLARDDVDAVYIATPDHWHAVMTIAAAKAGKHIYCQKPLTRTVAEGQAVVDAIKRSGVVFQMGTQQRHDERMLFGSELVLNGYIGELKNVKIGSPAGLTCPPQPSTPVPPGLDWDMWLGPAPWAPFTPLRIQSHPWYHISDYSLGYIAGWGIHHADSASLASGLDNYKEIIEVDATGIFPKDGLFDNPYRWQMHYMFEGGLTWHWTETESESVGALKEPEWPQHRMGIELEGTEGSVFIWRNIVDANPKSLLHLKIGSKDKVHLADNLPGSFIDCVREGRQTCAPVETGHHSTNLCSIAAIGMLLNRTVYWDAAKQQFVNDDEANRLLSRPLRGEWIV